VLERFPALKIVLAENDTGWLPHFMYRLDHTYERYGGLLTGAKTKLVFEAPIVSDLSR